MPSDTTHTTHTARLIDPESPFPPPARSAGGAGLTRRRFLQIGAAGVGGLTLVPFVDRLQAFAAPPVGAQDGIVVLVCLNGGNDGLNTVAPVGEGRYHDLRGGLAVAPGAALMVGDGIGLHPSLARLKARWDQGKVAIVQGVGYQPPDLSHFNSIAIWMQGWAGAGSPASGWVGRYLDTLPNAANESLYAVSIGWSVPPHLVGAVTRGASLPTDLSGAFGMQVEEPSDQRLYDAIRSYGAGAGGAGPWGDLYGSTAKNVMDIAGRIQPAYQGAWPDTSIGRQLVLCARLINANLGIRVLNAELSGFDTHSDQAVDHAALLAAFDGAVDAFFGSLDAKWHDRTVVVAFSEFGRRPRANGDNGTDHGTAGPVILVGNRVRPGLHGAAPSLTQLDRNDNLIAQVDFRSVYAALVSEWLKTDTTRVLGTAVAPLDLFGRGPGNPPPQPPRPKPQPKPEPRPQPTPGRDPSPPKPPSPPEPPKPRGYWIAGPGGSLRGFGQAERFRSLSGPTRGIVGGAGTPSGEGLYLCASDGGIFTFGDARFRGSTGAMQLNRPIVAMAVTASGKGYYLCASDGGIFTFGDARYFGSTAAAGPAAPIVSIARTPSGRGYWLLDAGGHVYAFGDARYFGGSGRAAAALIPVRPS